MEKLNKINILYEDNHLLVVVKKAGMPVCEDSSKDEDLLTILKEYIKDKYQKPGNVYLGLVHRLDRPVSGIMVFAKTSKCASRLSEQIRNKSFTKTYAAIVTGKVNNNEKLVDYLVKDNLTNTSYVTTKTKGKESILEYQLIQYRDNLSLVKIALLTGRHHQIRVQFASRNHPLYGDHKYDTYENNCDIALIAKELSFYHPITKELMHFEIDYPTNYPWNIFKEEV